MTDTDNPPQAAFAPFPRKLLILIALLQGLLLYGLYRANVEEVWPATQPVVAHLLLSVVLVIPTLLLLALTDANRTWLLWISMSAAAITALFSGYIGWQLQPNDIVHEGRILFIYYTTLALFLYKATMYAQVWSAESALSYRALFQYSWRNTILMVLCLLFTLLFWGILVLWGNLFDSIGISIFKDIFEEQWFLFPTLSLAYGLAFTIFRKLVHILDTLARVLQALCQFLLPVLVFVALLFLVALPFTGLEALWKTGSGTALVLWLQAVLLFFVNAVYQDENHKTPYGKPLHRLIYIGVALLPIYSLIAGSGLYLRVEQYGLTVARCWAIFIWAVMALFVFSYCWATVRRRDAWVTSFRTTNVRLGLLVLALMVLVNTALLDFRKMSINSQLARLESGQQSLEQLDIYHIAHHLGRPGYLVLEDLKRDAGQPFQDRITAAYYRWTPTVTERTNGEMLALITPYPADLTIPQKLIDAVIANDSDARSLIRIRMVNTDLNGDGQDEWVQFNDLGGLYRCRLWYRQGDDWAFKAMTSSHHNSEQLRVLFEGKAEVSTAPAPWRILRIGDVEWRVGQ